MIGAEYTELPDPQVSTTEYPLMWLVEKPQAIFDIQYFRQNPKPFFSFAKVLFACCVETDLQPL